MASDVTMPRLSDSMEEGTVLKWLVEEGGEVKRGEPLVEIETDKANMTYEADESGTLEIVAKEGETLPVGASRYPEWGSAAVVGGALFARFIEHDAARAAAASDPDRFWN